MLFTFFTVFSADGIGHASDDLATENSLSDSDIRRNEDQIIQIFNKLKFIYAAEFDTLGIDFNLHLEKAEIGFLGGFRIRTREKGAPAILSASASHSYPRSAVPFIMCHEVGHVLGGYLKKVKQNFGTVEPEADYFAAVDCLKKLFLLDGVRNIEIANNTNAPNFYKSLCLAEADNPHACLRTIDSVASFFNFYNYRKWFFFIPIPEKNENIFFAAYPSDRCRFLTGVSGALCNGRESTLIEMITEEGGEGELVNKPRNYCENFKARRPKCWYPLNRPSQY